MINFYRIIGKGDDKSESAADKNSLKVGIFKRNTFYRNLKKKLN